MVSVQAHGKVHQIRRSVADLIKEDVPLGRHVDSSISARTVTSQVIPVLHVVKGSKTRNTKKQRSSREGSN